MNYTTGPFTIDELQFMQAVPRRILVASARAALDLNRLACEELANRGYDLEGVWVGFARAKNALLMRYPLASKARGQ